MAASESRRLATKEEPTLSRDDGKQCLRDAELPEAARDGDRRRIDQLLKLGASVNALDRLGRTPFMHAAANGHTDCVESLVHTWGADVNATTRKDDIFVCRTSLIYAAESGHHRCMDILIQAGADVNAGVQYKPMMLATFSS